MKHNEGPCLPEKIKSAALYQFVYISEIWIVPEIALSHSSEKWHIFFVHHGIFPLKLASAF